MSEYSSRGSVKSSHSENGRDWNEKVTRQNEGEFYSKDTIIFILFIINYYISKLVDLQI